ncbi:hypothetical protein DFH09DRAFT_1378820 [Mycena vulgaris]|nr:hypothetical protein DFH09DRAFT_1378820 [Mycena vulgaris]
MEFFAHGGLSLLVNFAEPAISTSALFPALAYSSFAPAQARSATGFALDLDAVNAGASYGVVLSCVFFSTYIHTQSKTASTSDPTSNAEDVPNPAGFTPYHDPSHPGHLKIEENAASDFSTRTFAASDLSGGTVPSRGRLLSRNPQIVAPRSRQWRRLTPAQGYEDVCDGPTRVSARSQSLESPRTFLNSTEWIPAYMLLQLAPPGLSDAAHKALITMFLSDSAIIEFMGFPNPNPAGLIFLPILLHPMSRGSSHIVSIT